MRREADAALYRAKAGGRNTVRYFPEITEALVDYETLHGLGVEYSLFENQAALAALQLGDFPFALVHIQRAIVLDPKTPILKANLAYIQFTSDQPLQAFETFRSLHKDHPEFDLPEVYVGPEALAAYVSFKKDPKSVAHRDLNEKLKNAMQLVNDGKAGGRARISAALDDISSIPLTSEKSVPPPPKSGPNLGEIWTKLIEAVGRVSPFTRSYLVDGSPISFENEIFTIGFSPEFEDHLLLLDNARNQNLITLKLNELGYKTGSIKFVSVSEPTSG